ncbi:MAG: thioredoxin family protein [Verrucomicrobiales bacterium]|nr:thioredoxin family protein [Verrucomicrobiales bacterium]
MLHPARLFFLLVFFVLLPFSGFAQVEAVRESASTNPWTENYKAAVLQAKEEGKSLLLLFTGTDWIEICQEFDREIASAPEFYEPVSEKFVLVQLEYPKDNRLPKEKAVQNQLLRDAYRIRGFPSVILTHPDGRPFGLNGYQAVDPATYASQILEIEKVGQDKAAARKEASTLEGMPRAKKLVEAIPSLPGNLAARYYMAEMAEVIGIDEKEELEATGAFRRLIADVQYSAEMQKLAKNVEWSRMLELTDKYIADNELKGPALQKAMLNKAGVYSQMKNSASEVETLLEIVKMDEESPYGQEARKQLDRLRADKLEEQLGQ